jgi:hypothetical protein
MGALRYIDVVLMIVAAPILLLIGVPAVGYGVAGGVWLGLRVIEIGVNKYAAALGGPTRELLIRQLVFPLVRIFVLAITVILVRQQAGKDAGVTALALVVFVFTIHLGISFAERPRAR